MDAIVAKLKSKDLLKFDDGRYIMWAPGIDIPMTVVKVFVHSLKYNTEKRLIELFRFEFCLIFNMNK